MALYMAVGNKMRVAPMVEHFLMVLCIIRSIPHSGLIELFLISASDPQLVYQKLWCVLSCLWDGAYKRIIAANLKE